MAFVGATSKAVSTTVTSYTVTIPAGVVAGDLMFLLTPFNIDAGSGGNTVTVSGSTWVAQDTRAAGNSGGAILWRRTATSSSEPTITVTNTAGAGRGAAVLVVYRGYTLGALHWFPCAPGVAPTISATAAIVGQLGLAFAWERSGVDVAGDTWATPATWTKRGDADGFGAGGVTCAEWQRIVGSSGQVAQTTFTPANINGSGAGGVWLYLLTPTPITADLPALSGGGGLSVAGKKGGKRALGTALRTGLTTGARPTVRKNAEVDDTVVAVSGGGALHITGAKDAGATDDRTGSFGLQGGGTLAAWVGAKTHPANAVVSFESSQTFSASKETDGAAPALSGGGALAIAGVKRLNSADNRTGTFSLTGGGNPTQPTQRKGAKRALGALSGGGNILPTTPVWAAFRTAIRTSLGLTTGGLITGWTGSGGEAVGDDRTGSFSLTGGITLGATVNAKTARRRALGALSDGGDFDLVPPRNANGGFVLRTGSTFDADITLWTAEAFHTAHGTFSLSGGGALHAATGTPPATGRLVQLVWNVTVDDHPRPTYHPLWRRVRTPNTKYGLLLYRDGRVVETYDVTNARLLGADFVVTARWYGRDTDWQARVLLNAGYTLVAIPSIAELVNV